MNAPAKVTLSSVLDSLPFALGTCYQAHSKKRWDWLSRTSPEGRRTRELWVDVKGLMDWSAARGMTIRIGGRSN